MAAIKLNHAESSHIKGAAYDAETQVLVISFAKADYAYSGVPENVVRDFEQAPSAGQFLETGIKGQYPYQKV